MSARAEAALRALSSTNAQLQVRSISARVYLWKAVAESKLASLKEQGSTDICIWFPSWFGSLCTVQCGEVLLHNSWTPMHADDTQKLTQCLQARLVTERTAQLGRCHCLNTPASAPTFLPWFLTLVVKLQIGTEELPKPQRSLPRT
eukprot:6462230-Amphidinium_carterae.1